MSLTYIALVWAIKHHNERHSGTANLVKCILITAEKKASFAFPTAAAATYFTVNTKQISLNAIRLSIGFQHIVYLSMQFLWHFSHQVDDRHKGRGGGGELHHSFCFKPVLGFSMFLLLSWRFTADKTFPLLPLTLRIFHCRLLRRQTFYQNCANQETLR